MSTLTNTNPQSVNRPGKPTYLAMMSALLFCFSLPAFYWAFDNFKAHGRTSDFVQQLRADVASAATPTEQQELSQRVASLLAQANRRRFEMLLSGAGGLVLLGVAALLMGKSRKARAKPTLYAPADLGATPPPTTDIAVHYKSLHGTLLTLAMLFLVGMLSLLLHHNFTSSFISFENAIVRSLIVGVPILSLLAVVLFLSLRAKRQAVRSITKSGVERGDGRRFLWSDFCGVVTHTDYNRLSQRRYVWRIELAFSGGETAWLIPHRIENYDPVFACLSVLPAAIVATRS